MQSREQIFKLLRDLKWIIGLSIFLALLLAVPDQVKELYRIAYSNSIIAYSNDIHWTHILSEYLRLYVPILLLALIVWAGAFQIAAESVGSLPKPMPGVVHLARLLPPLLGGLPLLGSTFGIYDAVPVRLPLDNEAVSLVGSPWEHYDRELNSITFALYAGAAVQLVFIFILIWIAFRADLSLRAIAMRLNANHLARWPSSIITLALIALTTSAFVFFPVALPQFMGSFFILTLFALCVATFVVNFSLLGVRYQLPIISSFCVAAIIFSLLDLTDNHHVRLIESSSATPLENSGRSAADEFKSWLETRPDRQKFAAYPVFLVAAQGGGIYAAYQSALFLARLQDLCPAFRHHLFAISSVSGGSLGAAMFSAALSVLDENALKISSEVPAQPAPADATDPCPGITAYYQQDTVLQTSVRKAGPLENAVSTALSRDFLSPLVAATLFPDFTQRFLFFPVGLFDRARALEYTFEAAGKSLLKDNSAENPFDLSILQLWHSNGSIPALLMNATDAGSGRRVVIAPFKLAEAQSQKAVGTLLDYQFRDETSTRTKSRDLKLSTAVGISARFPWITPAATIDDARLANTARLKLVDGGYVDNSGLETIFDLKNAISDVVKNEDADVNLIVLSGGEFPLRKNFALGETLEPIRALLNSRTSRSYLAIERAERLFPSSLVNKVSFENNEWEVYQPTLLKARLDTRFYELPLGWLLSDETSSIIDNQSGRFWECTPDQTLAQVQQGLAPADCVQLLVYHILNQSVNVLSEQVAVSSYLFERDRASEKDSDIESIIACYRERLSQSSKQEQTFDLEQTGNMRALMTNWHHRYGRDKDPLMAYVMGTAAVESNEFLTRRQSLEYSSAERILRIWPHKFDDIPELSRLEEIATQYVHHPRELAEKVYGGINENGVANGDGWLYRGRGLAFLTFKEKYRLESLATGFLQLLDDPELIFIPDVNSMVFLDTYFPTANIPSLEELLTAKKWLELRALVMRASGQGGPAGETAARINKQTQLFGACIKDPKNRDRLELGENGN